MKIAHQYYRAFTTFYRNHTGSDWQQIIANGAILGSAVLFLIGFVVYGGQFLVSGNRSMGLQAIYFAGAKAIAMGIFLLDRRKKKHVNIGGPVLVLTYLSLGALFQWQTALSPTGLSACFIAIGLMGFLYGIWCSFIPTLLSSLILICYFADALQDNMRSHVAHYTSYNFSTILLLASLFGVWGVITGGLHIYATRRHKKIVIESDSETDNSHILYTYDLTVDTRKHEVTRAGTTIPLRRKEYEILTCLIGNKGHVTNKQTIIKSIWDTNVPPDSLGVHIKYLRDKIDKPYALKLIETSHGVGYALKDLPRPDLTLSGRKH